MWRTTPGARADYRYPRRRIPDGGQAWERVKRRAGLAPTGCPASPDDHAQPGGKRSMVAEDTAIREADAAQDALWCYLVSLGGGLYALPDDDHTVLLPFISE